MSTIARRTRPDCAALPPWARIACVVALWRRRARERRLLAGLSPEQLKDFGLSRADACREAAKPFWRE
ncbi:MAG: DUF1127 domain-containing protein [Rhodospirillales bacterium]